MKTILDPQSTAGVQITEHGLRFTRLVSFDEWQEVMRSIKRVKRSYLCIFADAAAYGRKTFGDEAVNETIEQLEFDLQDAVKAHSISLISLDERNQYNLSPEHAYVLGTKLDDPKERTRWAALCEKHGLTAHELKRSIEAGKIIRAADMKEAAGHTGGIPTIQGVRFHFERWRRNQGAEEILRLPVEDRRKTLETLAPIVELAAAIEASLES